MPCFALAASADTDPESKAVQVLLAGSWIQATPAVGGPQRAP